MARREFPTRVRVAAIKRATKDGLIFCEKCGALAKRFQIDHVRPDALLGEPVIENAMLICEPCYSVKNPDDTRAVARAKRREAKDLGAVKPKAKIAAPAKPAKPERRFDRTPLAPRNLFEDAT